MLLAGLTVTFYYVVSTVWSLALTVSVLAMLLLYGVYCYFYKSESLQSVVVDVVLQQKVTRISPPTFNPPILLPDDAAYLVIGLVLIFAIIVLIAGAATGGNCQCATS